MDKREQWNRTQLVYDGELWSYSKYTREVIRKGHRLVVGICEETARERGGKLTILDVGCGWADFHPKLAHVVGAYVGVEPAVAQILRAPQQEQMYLMRGSGERMVVGDACADLGLLISVLDHCLDAEKTIREVFRILRPGGKAVILLENRGRFSNDVRAFLGMEVSHGEEHLYYFDVDDVLSLVEPHGQVVFLRSYGFLLGFDRVSRIVPRPLVSGLSAVADGMLGAVAKKKGQHVIVVARKRGGGPAAPLSFRCPHCEGRFQWQEPSCRSCGRALRWLRPGLLDLLETAPGTACDVGPP